MGFLRGFIAWYATEIYGNQNAEGRYFGRPQWHRDSLIGM